MTIKFWICAAFNETPFIFIKRRVARTVSTLRKRKSGDCTTLRDKACKVVGEEMKTYLSVPEFLVRVTQTQHNLFAEIFLICPCTPQKSGVINEKFFF